MHKCTVHISNSVSNGGWTQKASSGDTAITFTMSRTAVSIATLGASGSMLGSEQLGSCDAPTGVFIRLDA